MVVKGQMVRALRPTVNHITLRGTVGEIIETRTHPNGCREVTVRYPYQTVNYSAHDLGDRVQVIPSIN